jgi:hypothetical protein
MPNNNDLKIMQNPELWPGWPCLPVVRRGRPGSPQIGILIASNLPTLLEDVNLFGIAEGSTLGGLMKETAKEGKLKQFDSFEAIIADGWEVD